MKIIELLELIEKNVKNYRHEGIANSIIRNSHMNNFKGTVEDIDPDLVDAILVDFVNFLARNQCVDYGMYTCDLDKED